MSMYRALIFISWAFAFGAADTAWSKGAGIFHVLIDPGHGGSDQGASGPDYTEAKLTLSLSQILKELLNQEAGYRAFLTRSEDRFLPLESRPEFAAKVQADALISIHGNWSRDVRAHGAEIYFQNLLAPDEESLYLANLENQTNLTSSPKSEALPRPRPTSPRPWARTPNPEVVALLEDLLKTQRIRSSFELAKQLVRSWSPSTLQNRARIRQAPFFVVSQSDVPSVLIEIGYLSHPEEGRRLATREYQREIASDIVQGLKRFKEALDKRQE